MSDQQPDWYKITEGKIRHGVAVAFIEQCKDLTADNMKTMEKWVQFIIHGYHGIKEILDRNGAMTDKQLADKVKDEFNGTVVKETDEQYVASEIINAVDGLGAKDKNKVMYQLKNGNITIDNLKACLTKIEALKQA